MFTQCPACQTIFKISAEVLRAAAGEVRCGRCGEIFNALRSLAEEPRAFTAGESQQEQEARADKILRHVAAVAPAEELTADVPAAADIPPGTQIIQLDIQGGDEMPAWEEEPPPAPAAHKTIADDPSMEFTLPPGELDRIFVEARPHHFVPGRHNLLLNADVEELEPVEPAQLNAESAPAEEASEQDEATLSDVDVPDYLRAAPATSAPAPDAEPRRNDWIETIIPTREIEELVPAREQHRGRWTAAALLLVLLLGVQLVHQHRDALAGSPAWGGALRSLYRMAGQPIQQPLNLSAFEVRQWGVTGDASASGTLRVRASLINTGVATQPYPLLRLTLADRFGKRVGARDFLPGEYLRRPPARDLEPGERADAIVEIVDPGKTAEGFEIDVCERQQSQRVICANDAPHAK